jgi:glycosyltransferase involved in cell wall biosynthesis
MARARALVVPNVEEFGIASVEAQAAGRPVIGPDHGGTTETVIDGKTGVLFPTGDFDALAEVLREVDFDRFESGATRRSALRFSTPVFRKRLIGEVRRMARQAWPAAVPDDHAVSAAAGSQAADATDRTYSRAATY